jgi:protein-S-isoprenylcysteine O-methyltransferase Ste14
MMQHRLLHILAYEWMVFGACWASFNLLLSRGDAGQSQRSRHLRFIFLAVTFLILFLERHAIPPVALIVLCLIWGALSLRWAAPTKAAHSGEFPFYRLLRLVVLAITFALLFWNQTAIGILGGRFVPPLAAIIVVGFTIASLGLVLALWARIHLGRNWSDKVVIQAGHQLIRTGPYARLRHPIYSGVLLGVLGTAVVLGEWRGVIAFVLLLTNYAVKARKEDRVLAETFGAEFKEHEQRAGFLLPGLRVRE